jgi:hypothetical protein
MGSGAAQVFAFHDQRPLFDAVDRNNIRMGQRGQQLGFTTKAREPVGVGREGVRPDLDCQVTVELGVGGAIHSSHAAFSELGGDAVAAPQGQGAHGRELQASYHFPEHATGNAEESCWPTPQWTLGGLPTILSSARWVPFEAATE